MSEEKLKWTDRIWDTQMDRQNTGYSDGQTDKHAYKQTLSQQNTLIGKIQWRNIFTGGLGLFPLGLNNIASGEKMS